jgi:UDP-N-acetylmuramoylalanine--D-glutamate ligase
LSKSIETIRDLRVTIMGLGLHGGGIETALFFARNGARVTVTDLKDETVLGPSIEKLSSFPIRYVLGRHEDEDFKDTDLVIKNPGVPATSKFIRIARSSGVRVESDISIFANFSDNPIIAVTGSKGKSTVASAIHFSLEEKYPGVKIGGNITVSPLSFMNLIGPETPVVLELSSWQLADLAANERFKPKVSLITNILPDHMNWYKDMEDYLADKKIIYRNQEGDDASIFNLDDPRLSALGMESRATTYFFSDHLLPVGTKGAYLDGSRGYVCTGSTPECIFDEHVKLPGYHNKMNLLAAGLACSLFGMETELIAKRLACFTGTEHRLECFLDRDGVAYYNDSAATIPHATAAALKSLVSPVFLITGGTDKNIDFAPFFDVCEIPAMIYLLEGNATDKMIRGLSEKGVRFKGPFSSLDDAVREALGDVRPGGSLLFSPACASFGMFQNEFDRGRKYKACVMGMLESKNIDK